MQVSIGPTAHCASGANRLLVSNTAGHRSVEPTGVRRGDVPRSEGGWVGDAARSAAAPTAQTCAP
eukprot:scaffold44752_cov37-Phaeocystis_antarctica.AAC.2